MSLSPSAPMVHMSLAHSAFISGIPAHSSLTIASKVADEGGRTVAVLNLQRGDAPSTTGGSRDSFGRIPMGTRRCAECAIGA
jgi:hypothetical protein